MALQRSAGNAAVGRLLAREPAPVAAPPASAGVDWLSVWDELMFTEDGMPTSGTWRMLGELARVVPFLGFYTGAGADALAIYQDLTATWESDAPITHALMTLRGGVNLLNNGFGHFIYVSQIGQDLLLAPGAATSGTLTAFTASVNEVLAWIKVAIDTAQGGLDATIATMALWNAIESGPPAPGNQEAFDTWMQLAANYESNLIGDAFGVFVDGLDILTA